MNTTPATKKKVSKINITQKKWKANTKDGKKKYRDRSIETVPSSRHHSGGNTPAGVPEPEVGGPDASLLAPCEQWKWERTTASIS